MFEKIYGIGPGSGRMMVSEDDGWENRKGRCLEEVVNTILWDRHVL